MRFRTGAGVRGKTWCKFSITTQRHVDGVKSWLHGPQLGLRGRVPVPVPDLDRGLAFYRDVLGHQLIWRTDSAGQAGLRTPDATTEIVLTTRRATSRTGRSPRARIALSAVAFGANGGKVLVEPEDIPICLSLARPRRGHLRQPPRAARLDQGHRRYHPTNSGMVYRPLGVTTGPSRP